MKKTSYLSNRRRATRLACFVLTASLAFGMGLAAAEPKSPAGYTVQWASKMMRVHRENDAKPRAALAPVAEKTGSFALGPLAGLRGEITVVDGKVYVARVVDGKPSVSNDPKQQAPFLVYGTVEEWQAFLLPADVTTLADLEAHVERAARAAKLNMDAPFPFKLRVESARLDYHIISNPDEGYIIKHPHTELMIPFTIEDRPATLIGVYSTAHAGVFTHHGSTTHIHVVSDDGLDAGHLDQADLGENGILLLPKP